MNLRWQKEGQKEEIQEAFRVFDRYERMQLKPSDLKQVFAEYLDHPVNE